MPFTLSSEYIHSGSKKIIIFKFTEKMTEEDFNKLLAVLDKLLSLKKPFAFIIDAKNSKLAPLSCGIALIHWMSRNKQLIKQYLVASCIVTNYKKLITVIRWVFTKQKPTSPNLLTSNYDEGYNFVREHLLNPSKSIRIDDVETKVEQIQLINEDVVVNKNLDEELELIIVQKD